MKSDINIPQFKIVVFRAIDEQELCKQYIEGHVKVLNDYGITNITTNNNTWIFNPNIYCTIAIDSSTNKLVGGTRIQIADGINPLPVELAIGKMDKRIYDKINFYRINGGIGESCGLWISKEVKSLGISRYLMWASISSSINLEFQTLLGICAGYTLKMFSEIGFIIDYSLGDKGDFPYPNDEYIAHVIGILNAKTLESAAINDKNIMLLLRKQPNQIRIEVTKNLSSKINYYLVFDNKYNAQFKEDNNSKITQQSV